MELISLSEAKKEKQESYFDLTNIDNYLAAQKLAFQHYTDNGGAEFTEQDSEGPLLMCPLHLRWENAVNSALSRLPENSAERSALESYLLSSFRQFIGYELADPYDIRSELAEDEPNPANLFFERIHAILINFLTNEVGIQVPDLQVDELSLFTELQNCHYEAQRYALFLTILEEAKLLIAGIEPRFQNYLPEIEKKLVLLNVRLEPKKPIGLLGGLAKPFQLPSRTPKRIPRRGSSAHFSVDGAEIHLWCAAVKYNTHCIGVDGMLDLDTIGRLKDLWVLVLAHELMHVIVNDILGIDEADSPDVKLKDSITEIAPANLLTVVLETATLALEYQISQQAHIALPQVKESRFVKEFHDMRLRSVRDENRLWIESKRRERVLQPEERENPAVPTPSAAFMEGLCYTEAVKLAGAARRRGFELADLPLWLEKVKGLAEAEFGSPTAYSFAQVRVEKTPYEEKKKGVPPTQYERLLSALKQITLE